jgi:hypothetical protein
MISVIRPDFEEVEKERIFNKIKYLQNQNVSVFFVANLVPGSGQKQGVLTHFVIAQLFEY